MRWDISLQCSVFASRMYCSREGLWVANYTLVLLPILGCGSLVNLYLLQLRNNNINNLRTTRNTCIFFRTCSRQCAKYLSVTHLLITTRTVQGQKYAVSSWPSNNIFTKARVVKNGNRITKYLQTWVIWGSALNRGLRLRKEDFFWRPRRLVKL